MKPVLTLLVALCLVGVLSGCFGPEPDPRPSLDPAGASYPYNGALHHQNGTPVESPMWTNTPVPPPPVTPAGRK